MSSLEEALKKADSRVVYALVFSGGTFTGGTLASVMLLVVWLFSGSGDPPATANDEGTSTQLASDTGTESAQPSPSPGKAAPFEKMAEVNDKLKRIGLAFLNFHDVNRMFAFPRARDQEVIEPNRRPAPTELSWRVHLLPFLDQRPLYEQFHLDEPWDSPHNQTLLEKMPEVYRIQPTDGPATRFQVFTGPNMVFGNDKPPKLANFRDGSRHTILAVVVGPDKAVPWTKPDELTLDPNAPLASFGTLPDQLIKCVMADGTPLILHANVEPATILALATPNGKEIVDAETYRRQWEEEGWDALEKNPLRMAGPLLKALAQNQKSAKPNEPAKVSASASPPPDANRLLAIRNERMKKLKDLVLAMHNYHDTYRQFPPAKGPKFLGPDGKPYLSWRVHLLPFLDHDPLYSQFKLDEPWDSPNNRALLEHMPDVLSDPEDSARSTTTRFVTLTGPATCYPSAEGMKIPQFIDGTSTTLLIVAAGRDKAVPWTAPQDLAFDPSTPVECLGQLSGKEIFYARSDGAVKVLRTDIPSQLFAAIVSPAGSEQIPSEFDSYVVQ